MFVNAGKFLSVTRRNITEGWNIYRHSKGTSTDAICIKFSRQQRLKKHSDGRRGAPIPFWDDNLQIYCCYFGLSNANDIDKSRKRLQYLTIKHRSNN